MWYIQRVIYVHLMDKVYGCVVPLAVHKKIEV